MPFYSRNGTVKCTEKACNGDDKPCGDRGVTRDSGAEWLAPDGCNKCHCENGVISCTEIACEGESGGLPVLSHFFFSF